MLRRLPGAGRAAGLPGPWLGSPRRATSLRRRPPRGRPRSSPLKAPTQLFPVCQQHGSTRLGLSSEVQGGASSPRPAHLLLGCPHRCAPPGLPDSDQLQVRVAHVPRLTAAGGPHAAPQQNHGASAGCSGTRKPDVSRSDHRPGGAGRTLACGWPLAPDPGPRGVTYAPRATRGRDCAHGRDPERR